MRFPPPLTSGARVALVAPSGPLRAGDLERAGDNARMMGWEPVIGEHVLDHNGYLAGADADRLADLNRFAADETIQALWCIRGGYGAMRLLDGLDYDAWSRHPKTLIGYSDVTALHAAVGQRASLVTYHGPTARGELTPYTLESFRRAMDGSNDMSIRQVGMQTLRAGRARGRLTGGNLALIAAMAGTPFAHDLDGAILVLEDVGEAVYRIDRMLTQLWLTGGLARVAGIAFGKFTEVTDDGPGNERRLIRVLEEIAERTGVPCVTNFPIGHIDDHVTLALGATAELDADAGELVIERA